MTFLKKKELFFKEIALEKLAVTELGIGFRYRGNISENLLQIEQDRGVGD